MNASPDITAQFALMWMLIPALICLFGIGIGIVTAFRRGDARVPLAIGGLGFVALLFSLPFTSSPERVQPSPTALEHFSISPTQHMNVITTKQPALVPLLFLTLIGGAIVAGIVVAIRNGYTHAPIAIGVFAGICVVAMYYLRSHPGESPQTLGLLLMGGLFVGSQLGLGYILRDGAKKGKLITWGMCLGVVGIVAAMGLAGFQQTREESRRTQIQDNLRQLGNQLHHQEAIASVPPSPPAPDPTPTGPTPSQILYTTGNAQPISIQELPGWRKNPPHEGTLGAGQAKYVLTSQQFATVEEAEAELFKSLTVDVQESFAKYNSPAVGWTPTPEDLRLSGIIAERVVETFSVKVGEFENPVHRVSWLIEFDQDKSTVLLKRWEPIEAQRRSKLILSILAGASGVLGVTAMALRRRRNQPTTDAAPANQLA